MDLERNIAAATALAFSMTGQNSRDPRLAARLASPSTTFSPAKSAFFMAANP